jgi:cytochrome P450 family 3 subfamily A
MTLEVILSTAFGVQSAIQSSPNNEFLVRSREIFKAPLIFRIMLMMPFRNVVMKIFRLLSGNIDYFRTVADDILRTRKDQDIQGTRDLVDIMLSAKNPDGSRKLDDDEIASQSTTFLLAGHETSSNTLSMTAYYLALNPDIQERLKYEILIAQQTNPEKAIYDLLPELEYLECVINEVLRLSPPAHQTNRKCTNQYTCEGITIPAGMQVVFPIYTLHHDPKAWPEPEKFDPERFRGPAKESRHPFQFLPFGEGPRNCIGKRFALMEVKITLVNILSKYKFVRSPETQVPLQMIPGITLIPKDGVFLRIESCN